MRKPLVSVYLPSDLIAEIDRQVDGNYMASRTQAVRVAVTEWLKSRNSNRDSVSPGHHSL